eukprot:jgi/Antlo1/2097/347
MDRIVIFGASGDLAKRKLFPALSKLKNTGAIVLGYARTNMEDKFKESLERSCKYENSFMERVYYVSGQYDNIEELDVTQTTVFYISTPPHLYKVLVKQLVERNAAAIALEKPFGESLADFKDIMNILKNSNTQAYFIDHYLCKPMTIAIPQMFASNCKLKSLLSCLAVRSVEVLFKEKLGVEGRTYFDRCGLVKDVVQNHVLEIIGTICTANGVGKSCFFKSAHDIDAGMCMFGQYQEYKEEVGRDSCTETFCIIPIYFNNDCWKDVPFVVVAGKGLNEKKCEVRLEMRRECFEKVMQLVDAREAPEIRADRMWIVFNYSPREEVFIEVLQRSSIAEFLLYKREDILGIAASFYGEYSEHNLILSALLSRQPFPHITAQEAKELWRIFDCGVLKKKSLVSYRKGEGVPEQGLKLIEEIIGCC